MEPLVLELFFSMLTTKHLVTQLQSSFVCLDELIGEPNKSR